MTKLEAVKIYKQENKDFIIDCKQRKDLVMLREDWNNWTDSLCKSGIITGSQYNNWSNPF